MSRAFERLAPLAAKGMVLGLDTMRDALRASGDPQRRTAGPRRSMVTSATYPVPGGSPRTAAPGERPSRRPQNSYCNDTAKRCSRGDPRRSVQTSFN